MKFNEKLAAILEIRDWSQGKLAAKSGLSRRYIGMIISGERDSPSLNAAQAIARALEVSLDWLAEMPITDPGQLNPQEQELINQFRAITDDQLRNLAMNSVRSLAAYPGQKAPSEKA